MFDKEELEILEAVENDVLVQSSDIEEEIALAKASAKAYLSKSKNITLRLSLADLHGIKSKIYYPWGLVFCFSPCGIICHGKD